MGGLGYDAAGAGDPALLFLHGWCGDRTFFAPQFDYFAPTHRVVSVDLPGHGKSEVPEEYSIEAFASRVAELASELGLGRSVVFGHSIGAMVALALSQSAPELVGAVALIDPPPLSKEVWKGFAPQLISSFTGPDGPTGRRQFVEQMFLPTDDRDASSEDHRDDDGRPKRHRDPVGRGDRRFRCDGGAPRVRACRCSPSRRRFRRTTPRRCSRRMPR